MSAFGGNQVVHRKSPEGPLLTQLRHWAAKFAVVHNEASQGGIFLQPVW
jgi:hypothetical protein